MDKNSQPAPTTEPPACIDLLERCRAATHSGPQWAHECESLDITLLSWEIGKRIEAHANNEIDVVWIGIEGFGIVTIDGIANELRPGVAIVIPKGCLRSWNARSSVLATSASINGDAD